MAWPAPHLFDIFYLYLRLMVHQSEPCNHVDDLEDKKDRLCILSSIEEKNCGPVAFAF